MITPDPALDDLLGPAGAPRPWWRRRILWAVLALLLAGAAGTWYWLGQRQAAAAPQYTDPGGDTRRTDGHRHGQRHAAADHPGGDRQRALGHRGARCTSTSTTA